MGKDLLTKVAKGVAFGDVSNQAVRNILTELSKTIYGGITEQEMEDTMAFFDWKCPYTGRPLPLTKVMAVMPPTIFIRKIRIGAD